MISAVSTGSYSSERKMTVEHLNYRVIDYEWSWWSVIFNKINVDIVLTEYIHDKGFWFVSDLID